MEGSRTGCGSAALGSLAVRCLLAVPLALGVAGNLVLLPALLREPGQDARYYIVNAAICLVPAALYALAALLVVAAWARPLVWFVLLAFGLALSAVGLFYLITAGLGELFLVPPYLVAVAVVQLGAVSKAQGGHHSIAASGIGCGPADKRILADSLRRWRPHRRPSRSQPTRRALIRVMGRLRVGLHREGAAEEGPWVGM